jgi:hypothetical protein
VEVIRLPRPFNGLKAATRQVSDAVHAVLQESGN